MNRYQDLPYDDRPIPLSDPDRLAAIARLFGVPTTAAPQARVLELGCGTGANLLSFAVANPRASVTGLDREGTQFAHNQALSAELGLTNLRLVEAGLHEAASLGEHDVVLAHGLWSWVPAEVRSELLSAVASTLSVDGVAMVSFAALPGVRLRQALRDVLQARVDSSASAQQQVLSARQFANDLARCDAHSGAARALQALAATVGGMSDAGVFHDLLSPDFEPVLLRDFARCAAEAGLTYVCDAHLPASFPRDPQALALLGRHAADQVELETWLDAAEMRSFRHALLVRADAALDRGITGVRLLNLWLSTEAVPAGEEGGLPRFRGPDGHPFASSDPAVVEVLQALVAARPGALRVADLGLAPSTLQALLGAVVAGQVAVRTSGPGPASHSERPLGSALARAELERGRLELTNLRQQRVGVSRAARAVLAHADGTRDSAALAAAAELDPSVAAAAVAELGLGGLLVN